jgi:hypothetical protein
VIGTMMFWKEATSIFLPMLHPASQKMYTHLINLYFNNKSRHILTSIMLVTLKSQMIHHLGHLWLMYKGIQFHPTPKIKNKNNVLQLSLFIKGSKYYFPHPLR